MLEGSQEGSGLSRVSETEKIATALKDGWQGTTSTGIGVDRKLILPSPCSSNGPRDTLDM